MFGGLISYQHLFQNVFGGTAMQDGPGNGALATFNRQGTGHPGHVGPPAADGTAIAIRQLRNGIGFNVNLTDLATQASGGLGVTASAGAHATGAKEISPLRVTVSADFIGFDDNQMVDRDGEFYRVSFVSSYRLEEHGARVGAFVGLEGGEVDSNFLAASLERHGYRIGAFGDIDLPYDLNLTGEGSLGFADNDIVIAGATGEFNSNRYELHGRLTRNFQHQSGVWANAAATVDYLLDDLDAYTNSAGVLVGGQDVESVSIGFETRLGHTIVRPHEAIDNIRPWFDAGFDYDLDNEGSFQTTPTTAITHSDIRFNFGGGVAINFVNGGAISGEGGYFGSDTALEGYTARVSASLPFDQLPIVGDALGFGGTFNLDAGQRLDESSLTARWKLEF